MLFKNKKMNETANMMKAVIFGLENIIYISVKILPPMSSSLKKCLQSSSSRPYTAACWEDSFIITIYVSVAIISIEIIMSIEEVASNSDALEIDR